VAWVNAEMKGLKKLSSVILTLVALATLAAAAGRSNKLESRANRTREGRGLTV
jgi:hypothetical protein